MLNVKYQLDELTLILSLFLKLEMGSKVRLEWTLKPMAFVAVDFSWGFVDEKWVSFQFWVRNLSKTIQYEK